MTDDSMTVELLKLSRVHVRAVREDYMNMPVILSSVIGFFSA
jgi:hypothetical protein